MRLLRLIALCAFAALSPFFLLAMWAAVGHIFVSYAMQTGIVCGAVVLIGSLPEAFPRPAYISADRVRADVWSFHKLAAKWSEPEYDRRHPSCNLSPSYY